MKAKAITCKVCAYTCLLVLSIREYECVCVSVCWDGGGGGGGRNSDCLLICGDMVQIELTCFSNFPYE